jgi:hypothetical protein
VVRVASDIAAGRESSLDPIIKTLGLRCDQFPIHQTTGFGMYSGYMPYRWHRNTMLASTADSSALLMPLCLTPTQERTTGYLNASVAKNLELVYEGNSLLVPNETEAIVVAVTLNMLVSNNDHLTLKYPV